MKKILISTFGVLLCFAASAQSSKSPRTAFSENPNAILYSLPRTAVKVGVVVEKETIRKGPYARFAQRYLGVVAPLADKELYQIKGANIAYFEESDPAKVYAIDVNDKSLAAMGKISGEIMTPNQTRSLPDRFGVAPADTKSEFYDLAIKPVVSQRTITSHTHSDSSFVKVAPDRVQIEEKSLEQMAADAAKAIFTLRKSRFDLITGEAGENVFGAGLDAAIKEIARLEQEYLSLFLGKHSLEQIVKEYEILPDSGKLNYIVCRFSETGGLLPDSDLSGKPIILELRPESRAASYAIQRKPTKDQRHTIYYRVADVVQCRILDGKQEIAKERVPVYQFGTTVDVPLSATK